MQVRKPAVIDQVERVFEHRFGFGRKAGDDIGAEHNVRPQPAQGVAEADCVPARMAALHALEDQIIAGLQRQMQVRHQPLVPGECIDQIAVGLNRVD